MSFLPAFVLTKRVSELHCLSFRVRHSRDWRSCTFTFLLDFVAKTQNPSVPNPRHQMTSLKVIEMNFCSTLSQLFRNIYSRWSSIAPALRASSFLLVCGRRMCPFGFTPSFLILIHGPVLRIAGKFGRLRHHCFLRGTVQSIKF